MKPVWFEAAAEEDLAVLHGFYELQEKGAGDYLLRMLSLSIARLGLHHGFHPLRHGFHFVRMEKFPVGLFYRETEDRIEIIAAIDLRNSPESIARRLSARRI